jgi:phosphotransferase system HPr (HPr) family protein
MFRRPATRQVTVTYPKGIHVRPSTAIVKSVRQFDSKVAIRYGDREADASDIMAILALGVPTGAELTLLAEGLDSKEVLDSLGKLFAEDFGMEKDRAKAEGERRNDAQAE